MQEAKPAEPAPEAKKTVATEDDGQYDYHVVQAGENLYRLGINNGTTKEELMRLNDIKDATLVKVGQKIKIPKKNGTKAQPTTPDEKKAAPDAKSPDAETKHEAPEAKSLNPEINKQDPLFRLSPEERKRPAAVVF